ncbi:glucans biosynthesis glucosyltransferase MdoH [Sphingomonas solaris]|uniref:Glucans biosynthesis glucosyltransferase H n=1 Tax=Alterirhizorhabdus solaris TaxID=2529389 RepID=A0A558R7L2_9SPHN|nr:glucans biosynthesis glucosyltransferase MdoH [Sphingomonas solaris]TVV75292.1 glucans biosynthesis glucosyltransferase MdoH [Sphingomonas solaris]
MMPPPLPAESPLVMPRQRFSRAVPPSVPDATGPSDMLARRLLLLLATLLLGLAALSGLKPVLARDGLSALDYLLMLLFFPLFAWIAFGFVGAVIGFSLLMSGRSPGYITAPEVANAATGRTAVLMPVHNEDVRAVFARVAAMLRSIKAAGDAATTDFFILSDSGLAAGVEEERCWEALAPASPVPLYYRRRTANIAAKPGNIAEWVGRFGGAYAYMVVLDADSLMSGRTIATLASAIEARPAVALIQTVPTVIAATTLFQRWMQFASVLYGPVSTAGMLWWFGAEGTFWGHNAIVRTAAFAESCGLPELLGPAPFGGHVLSHDMVEAALLRRRGWAVHMVMIGGSYEEYPPTMIDHAIRDRRWAQGNIQHIRLLGSAGFHWVSRLQLLVGASAYITSPLWLLLILTTLAAQLGQDAPAAVAGSTVDVLALTVLLLFGPKAMALAWVLSDPARRHGFGGGRRLARSVAVEVVLSILFAPAAMLTQTIDLVGIVRGKRSRWSTQSRESDGISFEDALRRYRWHVVAGLLSLTIAPVAPIAAAWLAPVTLGLLAAPWLAMWTARNSLGTRARDLGLFGVPPAPTEPDLRPAGAAER